MVLKQQSFHAKIKSILIKEGNFMKSNLLSFFLAGFLLVLTACASHTNFVTSDSSSYLGLASTTLANIAKVGAYDGEAQDSFGTAIATSGNIMVIGANGNNSKGLGAGAAYIFELKPTGWLFTKQLTARDGVAGDHFGTSVAVDGNTVVIGANGSDSNSVDSGAAYVFERDEGGKGNWGEVEKLTANDGGPNEFFGYSVGISGDTIAIGAPLDDANGLLSGSSYIFKRNKGNWQQVQKVTPNDGVVADSFGISLALSKSQMIVGAWGDDDMGQGAGSAYIFERSGKNWQQVEKLLAKDGKDNDSFGYSVDIYKDTAVVGSWGNDYSGIDSGLVYVFEQVKDTKNWQQTDQLIASDAKEADAFGLSVAISGNRIVVGAPGSNDNGAYTGSGYIFTRSQGDSKSWQQVNRFVAKDGATRDFFSSSVAISGNTLIAGASVDDDNGKDSGSVYVYKLF